MTVSVAQIWRHPIKAHGFEALERSAIKAGQTMPWDRVWAVTHEASQAKDGAWASCTNFSRGAKAPQLMAVRANLDEDTEVLTLSHPNLIDLSFHPDDPEDVDRFLDWISAVMPKNRATSTGIVRTTGQGMTDSASPSVSLGNLATLRALEGLAGQSLDTRRFRLNVWVEGLDPYEELNWLNRTMQIGDVAFEVRDHPIIRCASTMANPDTGQRDADPLVVMEANWGHQEFGITLIAKNSGDIALGDLVTPT